MVFEPNDTRLRMSRRRLLGIAAGAALAGVMPTRLFAAHSPSLDRAYTFLGRMMDLYGTGAVTRLAQSYVPTGSLNLGDTAFTYDNAVTILAYLKRGQSDDYTRATVLGNSLIYAQQHDPQFSDGRLRASYHVDPFVQGNGQVNVASGATTTGNMAWVGLAFLRLYRKTAQTAYLQAAESVATWITVNTTDTRGAGGYTGGYGADGSALLWKSTEHNIDAYALFTRLHSLTHAASWLTAAHHALAFVEAMWNAPSAYFWTGTGTDGVTINTDYVPEDVQSWSYLALRNPSYAGALDWAAANLAATDGLFSGVSFSTADTSGVWFEGTGHMAAALQVRKRSGDISRAATYLQNIQLAQSSAPNADGYGIVAASHDGLQTGDGDAYYAALHIGATGWYCMAQQRDNPFLP